MQWDGPDPTEKTESKREQTPGAIDFPAGNLLKSPIPISIDRLCSPMLKIKTFLNVTYAEKEEVRKLGAKWDHAHKKWYWEGLVTPEIQKYLVNRKSFEDRYQEALSKFRSKNQ
jgi:hypothetical protein